MSTLVVIRLLAPSDYGLCAMARIMFVFLNTMNGYGPASALIRDEEVSEERLRQTLGMLLLINGDLAVAQFLSAPLVASYFEQPMVVNLLRVQSFLYFATPFLALPHAILSRMMDFRAPAQVRLPEAIANAATALGCAAEGGIAEHVEILADGSSCEIARKAIFARHRTLPMHVSPDQAGIDRKTFGADETLSHAALDGHLEQFAQQIAGSDPTVAVFREGRVVRHGAIQFKTARTSDKQG